MTHTLLPREPITPEEWAQRLAQAEERRRLGVECVMCAGAGGWPGHVAGTLVLCRQCDGAGSESYPQKFQSESCPQKSWGL